MAVCDLPPEIGIPGRFPGRVVAVQHPASVICGKYQREPVREMIHKGLMELTGAEAPAEAWRVFFEPGDVVGIKLNPVGMPHIISSPEVVQEVIDGLNMAGVPRRDIVAYDRYRSHFLEAGFDTWLPDGVQWAWATDKEHPLQLDMQGYDPDQYLEMALVGPGGNPVDAHHRRSYVASFLTTGINKMINLCVLKHHPAAGVTIALKNMSHGLVNNVRRSHANSNMNTCGVFIPAVVDLPVIRRKVVLHILDGVLGAYHGGPHGKTGRYLWAHKTMYFSTDPVSLDKTGWRVIDKKRKDVGRLSVAEADPDNDSPYYRMQPEHIEIAGTLGLGVFDDEKIDLKRVSL